MPIIANPTSLPWQPEEVIPYSLATGDLVFVSLDRGLEGLAIPSKAVYAMAAGSALLVLSDGDNELKLWANRYGCGESVDPGDVNGVVHMLQHFLDNGQYLHSCRQQARLAAKREFSRKVNVRRMLEVIRPLLH